MASKTTAPELSNTIEDIPVNLLEWYRHARACINDFRDGLKGEPDKDKFKKSLKALKGELDTYSEEVAGKLGILFATHGTDEKLFTGHIEYYEELRDHLITIKQLLDNQDKVLTVQQILDLQGCIQKAFRSKCKFIEECFLISSNFESEDIIGYLPTV